jgi:hypothetical protein
MNEVVTQRIGWVNVLSPLKKPDIRIFPSIYSMERASVGLPLQGNTCVIASAVFGSKQLPVSIHQRKT